MPLVAARWRQRHKYNALSADLGAGCRARRQ